MKLRKLLPSTCAAFASLMIFASAAAGGWPENCDPGETWDDEETGESCYSEGVIITHGPYDFCVANCGGETKLFSLTMD